MDGLILSVLAPLGFWTLLSGLDDLLLDVVCFYHWLQPKGKSDLPTEEALRQKPEGAVAILVPLWHEDRVIGRMVEHNVAAIKYRNYHFFIGAYPNDDQP